MVTNATSALTHDSIHTDELRSEEAAYGRISMEGLTNYPERSR